MPLVAAKCTQCGANLEIDNALEAALCPSCQTPFVTERAISNYNTYNQNNYKIENAQLHINDEKSIENRLKNAEVFFKKHNDEEKAKKIFESVTDDAPDDYRGWWGLVRVYSAEFAYTDCGEAIFHKIEGYAKRAFNVATKEILEQIQGVWKIYLKKVTTYVTEKLGEREKCEKYKVESEAKYYALQKESIETTELINKLQQEYDGKMDSVSFPTFGWYIGIVLIGVLGNDWFSGYFTIIAFAIFYILIVRIILLSVTSKMVEKKIIVEKGRLDNLQIDMNNVGKVIANAANDIQVLGRALA